MAYLTMLPSVEGKLSVEIEDIDVALWEMSNKILLTQSNLLDL